MKKIFIALSVLAVLGFSLAPALANVPGARDISPGSEFKSHFLVSKARVDTGSGPSTLLQISETKGSIFLGVPQVIGWSILHFNFYTVDSAWVYNVRIPITRWQTLLRDVGTMIIEMGAVKANLAVTFEGKDYYAGYVVVTEERWGTQDNIIADVIQADLSAGIAAMGEIPVAAYVGNMDGTILGCTIPFGLNNVVPFRYVLSGYNPTTGVSTITQKNFEVFSGHSMASATQRVWTGVCAPATWFALYPRYLINDANSAKTYWIFLRSSVRNTDTGSLVAEIPFHTWVINGEEIYRSVTIPIREMSIIDAGGIIPSALKLSLPYIGQMNLKIPGEVDPGSTNPVPGTQYLWMDLVGWNWKMAKSSTASLNWAGMTLMAADAGTVGTGSAPNY